MPKSKHTKDVTFEEFSKGISDQIRDSKYLSMFVSVAPVTEDGKEGMVARRMVNMNGHTVLHMISLITAVEMLLQTLKEEVDGLRELSQLISLEAYIPEHCDDDPVDEQPGEGN